MPEEPIRQLEIETPELLPFPQLPKAFIKKYKIIREPEYNTGEVYYVVPLEALTLDMQYQPRQTDQLSRETVDAIKRDFNYKLLGVVNCIFEDNQLKVVAGFHRTTALRELAEEATHLQVDYNYKIRITLEHASEWQKVATLSNETRTDFSVLDQMNMYREEYDKRQSSGTLQISFVDIARQVQKVFGKSSGAYVRKLLYTSFLSERAKSLLYDNALSLEVCSVLGEYKKNHPSIFEVQEEEWIQRILDGNITPHKLRNLLQVMVNVTQTTVEQDTFWGNMDMVTSVEQVMTAATKVSDQSSKRKGDLTKFENMYATLKLLETKAKASGRSLKGTSKVLSPSFQTLIEKVGGYKELLSIALNHLRQFKNHNTVRKQDINEELQIELVRFINEMHTTYTNKLLDEEFVLNTIIETTYMYVATGKVKVAKKGVNKKSKKD